MPLNDRHDRYPARRDPVSADPTPLKISKSTNWAAVWMLSSREWVRFYRQRNRVIGALGQPILFWLLFGTGMHAAFRGGDQDFMTYYMPGTLALIVLFTAIFATISIIEDRREGFLQNVLVAPIPRWTIAAGKILGGSAIAWMQAIVFLVLAIIVGQVSFNSSLVGVLALIGICSISMTALGVAFAWPMESTQGFHAIMNLVLMPLWLLSGAFFPIPRPGIDGPLGQWLMHWVMRCNPVTYAVGGIRRTMGLVAEHPQSWIPGEQECWIVSMLFMCATCAFALVAVVRPNKADVQT